MRIVSPCAISLRANSIGASKKENSVEKEEYEIILARLKLLDDYIKQLRELQPADFREYSENYLIHRTAERLLQISIEACLDIGRHIIAREGFRFPNDNRDIFLILMEEEVIPRDLLFQLEDMAGFRNVLVHEYAEIDQRLVYDNLRENLEDFVKFAQAIVAYLNRPSEAGTKKSTARESSARYTTRKRKPAKRHAR